ncbi:MAG: Nitrogenase [Deferribacteraceae bacterium]|nr:Nitrogenase [Deferribacteraceae bacterium]
MDSYCLIYLKKNKADLFIAGSRNMYVAMKGQIPYLDVNQERIKAYAGYEGMITLAGDIYHTMNSKVFKTVKNNPSFLRSI